MSLNTCPICNTNNLSEAVRTKVFKRPHGEVKVELLYSHCANCESDLVTEEQSNTNKKRMRAREKQYEGFLTGQQIFALRRRYGLTQKDAATIFGGGPVAFSKYESEDIVPTEAMNKLLWLAIEMPEAVQRLADAANVKLKGAAAQPHSKPLQVNWDRTVFKLIGATAAPTNRNVLHMAHFVYDQPEAYSEKLATNYRNPAESARVVPIRQLEAA